MIKQACLDATHAQPSLWRMICCRTMCSWHRCSDVKSGNSSLAFNRHLGVHVSGQRCMQAKSRCWQPKFRAKSQPRLRLSNGLSTIKSAGNKHIQCDPIQLLPAVCNTSSNPAHSCCMTAAYTTQRASTLDAMGDRWRILNRCAGCGPGRVSDANVGVWQGTRLAWSCRETLLS